MKRSVVISISLLICLFGLTAGLPAASAAEAPVKVLVLPFEMNAAQDVDYLRRGILDMLSTRLQWPGRVQTAPKTEAHQAFEAVQGELDDQTAKALGKDHRADYVVFGSVTVIGQNVSLDAGLVDVDGDRAPIHQSYNSEGLDGVIPQVNQFAETINTTVFGRPARTARSAGGDSESSVVAPPGPSETTEPGPAVPEYRRHPDTLLTGMEGRQQLSPLNPNFIVAGEGPEEQANFWRSPTIKSQIVGVDAADLDGDGRNEVVYAVQDKVHVARIERGAVRPIAEMPALASQRVLNVEAMDLTGDDLAEIVVSTQRTSGEAEGFILGLAEEKLVVLARDIPYYMREVQLPIGRVLAGQRSGRGEVFFPKIVILDFDGVSVNEQEAIQVPDEANIFNFSQGRVTDEGGDQTILVKDSEHLAVYDMKGENIITSKDKFASTYKYIDKGILTDTVGYTEPDDSGFNPLYLPARVLLTDLDEDGRNEVIVAQNQQERLTAFMQRWRSFKNGSMYSLTVDPIAFRLAWRTRELPGAFVDYRVTDYDNDGQRDLLCAVVLKHSSGMLVDAKSVIVAYELASAEEMRRAAEERREGR